MDDIVDPLAPSDSGIADPLAQPAPDYSDQISRHVPAPIVESSQDWLNRTLINEGRAPAPATPLSDQAPSLSDVVKQRAGTAQPPVEIPGDVADPLDAAGSFPVPAGAVQASQKAALQSAKTSGEILSPEEYEVASPPVRTLAQSLNNFAISSEQTAAAAATGLVAGFPAYLAGGVAAISGPGIKGADENPSDVAARWQDAVTYKPTTPDAKRMTAMLMAPVSALFGGTEYFGHGIADLTGSALDGALVDAGGQGVLMALFGAAVHAHPEVVTAGSVLRSAATHPQIYEALFGDHATIASKTAAVEAITSALSPIDPVAAYTFGRNGVRAIALGSDVDVSPASLTRGGRTEGPPAPPPGSGPVEGRGSVQYGDETIPVGQQPAPEPAPAPEAAPQPAEAAPAPPGGPAEPPTPPSAPTAPTGPDFTAAAGLPPLTPEVGQPTASEMRVDPNNIAASVKAIAQAPITDVVQPGEAPPPAHVDAAAHADQAGQLAGMMLKVQKLDEARTAKGTPPEQKTALLQQAEAIRAQGRQMIADYAKQNGEQAATDLHTAAASHWNALKNHEGVQVPEAAPVQENAPPTEREQASQGLETAVTKATGHDILANHYDRLADQAESRGETQTASTARKLAADNRASAERVRGEKEYALRPGGQGAEAAAAQGGGELGVLGGVDKITIPAHTREDGDVQVAAHERSLPGMADNHDAIISKLTTGTPHPRLATQDGARQLAPHEQPHVEAALRTLLANGARPDILNGMEPLWVRHDFHPKTRAEWVRDRSTGARGISLNAKLLDDAANHRLPETGEGSLAYTIAHEFVHEMTIDKNGDYMVEHAPDFAIVPTQGLEGTGALTAQGPIVRESLNAYINNTDPSLVPHHAYPWKTFGDSKEQKASPFYQNESLAQSGGLWYSGDKLLLQSMQPKAAALFERIDNGFKGEHDQNSAASTRAARDETVRRALSSGAGVPGEVRGVVPESRPAVVAAERGEGAVRAGNEANARGAANREASAGVGGAQPEGVSGRPEKSAGTEPGPSGDVAKVGDHVVNIGLDPSKRIEGSGPLTREVALKALEDTGVKVLKSEVRMSGTEPTVIASLDRPLTPEEGDALASKLKQDAIAQRSITPGATDLYGPKAEAWRPFQQSEFREHGQGELVPDRQGQEQRRDDSESAIRLRELPTQPKGLPENAGIKDIADFLNKDVARRNGGKPRDYNNPKDVEAAKKQLFAEIKYQLGQPKSGLGWYAGDVLKAWRWAAQEHPDLQLPVKRQLASIITGVMSPGPTARTNFAEGLVNWDHYEQHGQFSRDNPVTGTHWSGYPAHRLAIDHINAMLADSDRFGDTLDKRERGVVQWLLTKHPKSILDAEKARYGAFKGYADEGDEGVKANADVLGGAASMHYGVDMFGQKVGPFVLSLNGMDSSIAVDVWNTRTIRRLFGTFPEPDADGQINEGPTTRERQLAVSLEMQAAADPEIKALGVKNGPDAQGVEWFFEQQLYHKLGTGTESGFFSDGARDYVKSKGHAVRDEGAGASEAEHAAIPNQPEYGDEHLADLQPAETSAYQKRQLAGAEDTQAGEPVAEQLGKKPPKREGEEAANAELRAQSADVSEPAQDQQAQAQERKESYKGVESAYGGEGKHQSWKEREAAEAARLKESGKEPPEPDLQRMAQERKEPWYYSALDRAVTDKAPFSKSGEMSAKELGAWLTARSKDGTVKADEIKWSGLDDYLKLQDGKVTRDQVKQFLDQNGVKVTETVLGGRQLSAAMRVWIDSRRASRPTTTEEWTGVAQSIERSANVASQKKDVPEYNRLWKLVDEATSHAEGLDEEGTTRGTTKFSGYQLPGGKNYRELLLTLPQGEGSPKYEALRQQADALRNRKRGEVLPDGRTVGDTIDSIYAQQAALQDAPGFQSSHFDQPNILAHVRFNERTDANGKKVLFIEELQSDWAQKGRKEGFDTQQTNSFGLPTSSMVPSAPFVGKTEAWAALALKRMIRYAADNGFDRIAWTSGEQQAARYDLSKQVNRIIVVSRTDAATGEKTRSVNVELKGGSAVRFGVDTKGIVDNVSQAQGMGDAKGKHLSDVIGKDMAEKVMKADRADFSGLDLKVGGEGMKSFYDKIVPNVANDVLKKLGGGRVSEVGIGDQGAKLINIGRGEWQVGDGGPIYSDRSQAQARADEISGFKERSTQPGFDITPEMREKAGERQALFQQRDEPTGDLPGKPGRVLGTVAGWAKELADAYRRPPEFTESKKIIGKYLGEKQRRELTLSRLGAEIDATIPKDRQQAMVNWTEAGGDEALLRSRAAEAPKEYKQGYLDALTLTPEEQAKAQQFSDRSTATAAAAIRAGILEDMIENYVRHEWEQPESAAAGLRAWANSSANAGFRTNPREAMQRIFKSSIDGEKLGYIHKNKTVGYQLIAGERSVRGAISARQMLADLLRAKEADGRPSVIVGGSGSRIEPRPGEPVDAKQPYLIKPNSIGLDSMGYRKIDHPAMRQWKWVENDENGNPILLQGDMWVHPDTYSRLNSILGKSAISSYVVPEKVPIIGGTQPGRAALRAGSFVKSSVLLGPFHEVGSDLQALFYKVNPFRLPELDLKSMAMTEGVDHGLMLYNHNALQRFSEGVSGGGIFHKVPVAGDWLRQYQEYLFQSRIPRLKAALFESAVGRAEKYYESQLADGTITRDQMLDNVAKQTNAAFGELNYEYMGRNKTLQDTLRIGLLAPDFLEARASHAAQALRPYGREQAMSFVRSAVILSSVAQLFNMMFADDHKMDWTKPFTFRAGTHEFTPRSIVGDVYHLITDWRGFTYARLNPVFGRAAIEMALQRNAQGQKVAMVDAVKDVLKSWTPIPVSGLTKRDPGQSHVEAIVDGIAASVGIPNYKYRTAAEKEASDITFGHMKVAAATPEDRKRHEVFMNLLDRHKLGELSIAQVQSEAKKEHVILSFSQLEQLKTAREEGVKGRKDVLIQRMHSFSGPEVMDVWREMNSSEKQMYRQFVLSKLMRSTTMDQDAKRAALAELR